MCLWAHCVQVRFPFKAICTYSTISACIYRESLRLYRFPSALFPISSCFLVIGVLFHKGRYSVVTVCFFSACSVANLPFYWIVLVRAFAKVAEPLWTGIGALATHHCCVSLRSSWWLDPPLFCFIRFCGPEFSQIYLHHPSAFSRFFFRPGARWHLRFWEISNHWATWLKAIFWQHRHWREE